MDITTTSSTDPAPSNTQGAGARDAPDLRAFVFALFFIFGGITSLNDVIIPKLRGLFTLSYGEVMLVQSAFFTAYFLVSLPASEIVKKIGYMRTAVIGLLVMTLGCLLFIPASSSAKFSLFLVALFVLAAGITTVQVVANPLISMLGPPASAPSRLTFAQAFNSLGTTIFPYVGSMLILGGLSKVDVASLSGAALDAFREQQTHVIVRTYLGLALALVVVAILVWLRRKRLVEKSAPSGFVRNPMGLLRQPRFAFGALCIFLYVGAEVAIGSIVVNYLMQANVLALNQQDAGNHVALYWGGAMVGRFVGAFLLRVFSPGKVLASAAASVIVLLLVSANSVGVLSAYSLLAIGLFNSIMFPTIFSLACEGLGTRAADGSGIICVAIVGGAVVPVITGHAADLTGLKLALAIPAVCYAIILCFGLYARRPRTAPDMQKLSA